MNDALYILIVFLLIIITVWAFITIKNDNRNHRKLSEQVKQLHSGGKGKDDQKPNSQSL